jgi:rhodanese-related sulfurtransferase
VFDLAAASTGLNEKQLKAAGTAHEKIYLHASHHAGYYPGAQTLHLKLLFNPGSGALLGAQVVGSAGVDKRIDVLAVALRAGMTVYDLEHLELAYAPPYGSAKDPVNMAGFIASNLLRGDAPVFHAGELSAVKPEQVLVDVRSHGEFSHGTIPGAVNVPVDELRDRLNELPKDKELLVFCQVGLRGYLATRILTQRGYRARNLSGGYATYLTTAEA